MSINEEWSKVKDFHDKFGHPVRDRPTMLTSERVDTRIDWMMEEIGEFQRAKTVVDQADGMVDLIYFALGTLVEMGVRPERLFDIVHHSNMSKLFPDGKPHYNTAGKVVKPDTFVAPEPLLEQEISVQNLESELRKSR